MLFPHEIYLQLRCDMAHQQRELLCGMLLLLLLLQNTPQVLHLDYLRAEMHHSFESSELHLAVDVTASLGCVVVLLSRVTGHSTVMRLNLD